MMVLVLAAVLAAEASASAVPVKTEKPKLAALEIVPGAGVDASVAQPLTEAMVNEVSARGFFQVISQNDIRTMLGQERQRQMLGCSEQGSCLTELSDAIGARFVLSGTLAKLGDAYQLTLTTLDTVKAQPLGRSTRLANDLGALRAQLPYAVAEATATPLPPPPSKVLPISLMAAGGAAAVFGLVWGVNAFSQEALLAGELKTNGALPGTRADYEARANAQVTNKVIAGVALGAGVAAFVAGLLLLPGDSQASTRVALVPTSNGAALVGVFE